MAQLNCRTVGPFLPAVEDWISYEERLRFYLTANKVDADDKQRDIFLTICGTMTYSLVHSLTALKKPSELTFAEIIKLGAEHYYPRPSLAVQRFKFNSRSCPAGKSVAA